jgi:plasmid stability protein
MYSEHQYLKVLFKMGKPNSVKDEFAALLRNALKDRRGRMPSAAAVAREFNLRANGIEPVTQESVRRWLRGISMPEEQKMAILVSWLNLDLSGAMRRARSAAVTGNGHESANTPEPGSVLDGIDPETLERARLISRLPLSDQQLIKDFINRLVQKSFLDGHSAEAPRQAREGL